MLQLKLEGVSVAGDRKSLVARMTMIGRLTNKTNQDVSITLLIGEGMEQRLTITLVPGTHSSFSSKVRS